MRRLRRRQIQASGMIYFFLTWVNFSLVKEVIRHVTLHVKEGTQPLRYV